MDSSIPRSIIFLILLIISGGFFSAAETAFSFTSEIRMRLLADDGDKRAKRVVKILDDFDRTIVTFLIMINVIHISAAAVATVLFVNALKLGSSVGPVVATVVTTLAVFAFSETIPKNMAKANADSFALATAGFVIFLRKALTPFSFIFTAIGNGVKKLFGLDKPEPSVTEDEFSKMVENAGDEGIIEPEESEIIKSAIEFGDSVASEVMTPISKVVGIPIDASTKQIREMLLNEKYSRFPVYRGNISNVVGILQAADSLWKLANGKKLKLGESLTKPYFVHSDARLNTVFEGMCGRRCHFAVVTGEMGKTVGILTMEDILEEIVGEIYDEYDTGDGSLKTGGRGDK